MSLIQKYQTHNLEKFLQDIERVSIGMDRWLGDIVSVHQNDTTYPPHNILEVESKNEFILEVALAGFKQSEISVYTENNKLWVRGTKESISTDDYRKYVHRGIANRSFNRFWSMPDGIEVNSVSFSDGLLSVTLKKIVPESANKKVWL